MNINIPSISFGAGFVYKDRYIPNKQDITHDVIRTDLEEKLGPYFFYFDQLDKEKDMPALGINKTSALPHILSKQPQKQNIVDEGLLESLKIYAFRIRRKNELYSGEQLVGKTDKIAGLKSAGIKSIYSLAPDDEYKQQVEDSGLNYFSLIQSGLSIFDINGDMIKNLINNPESYVNEGNDEKIQGLKDFIKTLNGQNPDMPLPIYFGCHYGTDRTLFWYKLYKILKDEDMNKPLSNEAVNLLAEFAQEVNEHFRW